MRGIVGGSARVVVVWFLVLYRLIDGGAVDMHVNL